MKVDYFLLFYSIVRKNIKIILISIALYLFFLIANLPANIGVSALNLPVNVKLTSVSGTIWSGKVQNLKYSGIDLGTVSWKLQPLYLMTGAVAANVSMIKNQQHINTWAKLSLSGKLELEETRFSINLSSLQPLTYGMPFSYVGMASGYFPVSYIYKNNYVGINGKLSLNNLEMISPQRQHFGDFVIDFRAENDGMTSGRVKDNSEQLNMSGQLTLDKNGIFNFTAKLAAREKDSSLDNVISFLGIKDATGRVQLSHQFSLWQ